jgi:acyl-coenzyme A synthetase/AMP-(fatty) acid ligase
MYGLEYTVLAPLFSDVRIYAGNTLFPSDILSGVERTPVKRILVATPVHLRALVRSGLTFPAITRVLCATAPLTQDLAKDIAGMLATDICELYGCTEAGCLAHRDPVTTTEWTFFDEFAIERTDELVRVNADHLSESVTLSDNLKFSADGRFVLQGRGADLVKIGGKRGSLADLTNRLLQIDGVEDAVVFSSDPDPVGDGNEARLTALVVCPGRDIDDVRSELTRIVDPVFLPRPLRQVDALPRSRTGKLRRRDLQRLIDNSRR